MFPCGAYYVHCALMSKLHVSQVFVATHMTLVYFFVQFMHCLQDAFFQKYFQSDFWISDSLLGWSALSNSRMPSFNFTD